MYRCAFCCQRASSQCRPCQTFIVGTRQRVTQRFWGRFLARNLWICDRETLWPRFRHVAAAVGLIAYRSKASELPPGWDHSGGPAVAREITVVPRREVDYERRARTRFLQFRARQKTRKPDRTWSVPRLAGVARRPIKLSVRPLAAVGMHHTHAGSWAWPLASTWTKFPATRWLPGWSCQ